MDRLGGPGLCLAEPTGQTGTGPRPASRAASSRYHPSTPIGGRLQEYFESSEEKHQLDDSTSPPVIPDRVKAARHILEHSPPASDKEVAVPSKECVPSPAPTRYCVGDSVEPRMPRG